MSADEPIYVGSDSDAGAPGAAHPTPSDDLAFSDEDGGDTYGDASSIDDDDYGGDMGEPVVSTRQVRMEGATTRAEWSARGKKGGRRPTHASAPLLPPTPPIPDLGTYRLTRVWEGRGVGAWAEGWCRAKTNGRRSLSLSLPRGPRRSSALSIFFPFHSQAKPYAVLDEKKLQARQHEAVEAVTSVLSIPAGEAVRVLREFKW